MRLWGKRQSLGVRCEARWRNWRRSTLLSAGRKAVLGFRFSVFGVGDLRYCPSSWSRQGTLNLQLRCGAVASNSGWHGGLLDGGEIAGFTTADTGCTG